jgi:hypothetical protein
MAQSGPDLRLVGFKSFQVGQQLRHNPSQILDAPF